MKYRRFFMKKYLGYSILVIVLVLSLVVIFNTVQVIGVMDVGNFDEYAIIKGLLIIFTLDLLSKIAFKLINK